jgi:hypothetical protein
MLDLRCLTSVRGEPNRTMNGGFNSRSLPETTLECRNKSPRTTEFPTDSLYSHRGQPLPHLISPGRKDS